MPRKKRVEPKNKRMWIASKMAVEALTTVGIKVSLVVPADHIAGAIYVFDDYKKAVEHANGECDVMEIRLR